MLLLPRLTKYLHQDIWVNKYYGGYLIIYTKIIFVATLETMIWDIVIIITAILKILIYYLIKTRESYGWLGKEIQTRGG